MTGFVQALCRTCGTVTVPARLLRLVVCNVPDRSTYSWRCPRCGEAYERHVTARAASILREAGVLAEPWYIPAEALESHVGPPLDEADLGSFLVALETFCTVGDDPILAEAAPAPAAGQETSSPPPHARRLIDLVRHRGTGIVPPRQRN